MNETPYEKYEECSGWHPCSLFPGLRLGISEWKQTFIGEEISALLGYYALSCGNCLPTFRKYVSVPSSGGQQ
jgi:hypothetical protein